MKEDELRRLMQDLEIPPPDPAAKQRAIDMAMAEFHALEKQADTGPKKIQGLFSRMRLMSIFQAQPGRTLMTSSHRKWLFSGIATASVVAIGVAMTSQYAPFGDFGPASLDSGGESLETIAPSAPPPGASASPSGALVQEDALRRMIVSPMIVPPMIFSPAVSIEGDQSYRESGRDRFKAFDSNPVKRVSETPVSTFSIDVDTASYSFMRRQLHNGLLPQKNAVRIEELINYFDYAYPLPDHRDQPFSTSVGISLSPWSPQRKLLHIGIKGYQIEPEHKPRSNLVFLMDVSGSMDSPDKLELAKNAMRLLLNSLAPDDTVAIAVYAGSAGAVLEPTAVREREKILQALRDLSAGGSTAGGEGIELAYAMARSSFDPRAVNRIFLCTDGDFNVGINDVEELKSFIERQRQSAIYLSVLGFGQGNLNDELMQALAQNGNGVAAYIDTLNEAQKVLVNEASATLFPIAQDVKIQVEFNPATVAEYRLIGYETRALKQEDFNNDAVDAGDIGSGHSVTAIYEIVPVGSPARFIDDSRYQPETPPRSAQSSHGQEYAFLKIRYKLPGQSQSKLITTAITPDAQVTSGRENVSLRRENDWATAVAVFGQILRGGRYTGEFGYEDVIRLAQAAKGEDVYGYRAEFIQLVRLAQTINPPPQ